MCDFHTHKTYTVRDQGWRGFTGACFVALNKTANIPQFYSYTHDYSSVLEHVWDDPIMTEGEEGPIPYSKELVLVEMNKECHDERICFMESGDNNNFEPIVDQDEGLGGWCVVEKPRSRASRADLQWLNDLWVSDWSI